LVDGNDEDVTAAVSDDISETAGGEDASECAENNGPAEFSDSGVFFSSSECAINTLVVESERAIEPQLQKDLSDVADADRSSERIKSPAPVNDDGVVQAGDHNEQHVLTCLSSSAESVTRGNVTCMLDSSINSAESVDDVHRSSSLIRCSSEGENAGIELLLEGKDSLKSDATVACSMKDTLSQENHSSLRSDVVAINMDHSEGDVHLELSSVAETEVKAAESNDASNCVEHGEDDVHLELSSVTGTEVTTAESGIITYTAHEVKCDVHKSAVESAEPLAGASELSNAAVSVPDAATSLEHAADSDQTLQISCEVSHRTSQTSATEHDASATLVPDAASSREHAADSDQTLELSCDDVALQTSNGPTTEQDTSATSVVQDAASSRDSDQMEINCGDLSLQTSERSTTEQGASATSVPDAASSHQHAASSDQTLEINCDISLQTSDKSATEEDTTATSAEDSAYSREHAADSDQMEVNCGDLSLHTSQGFTTEQDASVTLVLDAASSHEHAASGDQTLEINYDISPQASDRPTTEEDASATSVQDAARSCENAASSDQTLETNCDVSFQASDKSATQDDTTATSAEDAAMEQEASATLVLDEHAADNSQTSEINCDDITLRSSDRSGTDTFEADIGSKQNVKSDADLSVVREVRVISTTSGYSCTEDSVLLSHSEVTAETTSCMSTVVLMSNVRSTVTTPVSAAVELESRRKTDDSSSVIILKNLLSTQPSDVSIPSSLPSVLSRTLSTASSLVTNPMASVYQLPQTVITSVTESKSTSSVLYRPVAALALNLGKNLVTEFVFQEIVAHEDKWKSASAAEKVPTLIVSLTHNCKWILSSKIAKSPQN